MAAVLHRVRFVNDVSFLDTALPTASFCSDGSQSEASQTSTAKRSQHSEWMGGVDAKIIIRPRSRTAGAMQNRGSY